MNNLFVLDLETRGDKNLLPIFEENIKAPGNIKDPEKIKLALEKKKADSEKLMATDTDFSEVICVGIKEIGGNDCLYTLQDMEIFFKGNTFIGENIENGAKIIRYNFDFITNSVYLRIILSILLAMQ